MSTFVSIQPTRRPRAAHATVAVRIPAGRPQIRISLSESVLHNMGWVTGTRMVVAVSNEAKQVLLRPAEVVDGEYKENGYKLVKDGSGACVTFPWREITGLLPTATRSIEADIEMSEEELLVSYDALLKRQGCGDAEPEVDYEEEEPVAA